MTTLELKVVGYEVNIKRYCVSIYQQWVHGNQCYKNNNIYNGSKNKITKGKANKTIQDLYAENYQTLMKKGRL